VPDPGLILATANSPWRIVTILTISLY
jgi:hypothetical protein